MPLDTRPPVLLLGGTGSVGTQTTKLLRQLHPTLPIAIASRNRAKAEALAAQWPHTLAVHADVDQVGLGLGQQAPYSAVVALLKENTLHPLRFAQDHGLPYISMADGAFEIGPAVARHVHRPRSAPVMLASHWAAGMTTLPILHYASESAASSRSGRRSSWTRTTPSAQWRRSMSNR